MDDGTIKTIKIQKQISIQQFFEPDFIGLYTYLDIPLEPI
jgi:hypothetical protein